MTEIRYYEFRALDKPLSAEQISELRAISSRAEITPTSFINEYNWGNLKADPARLVDKYFDAHLHITNYGTRELIFRLPRGQLDTAIAAQYDTPDCLEVAETKHHHILRFSPYLDGFGREMWWEDQHLLPSIIPVREQLARGDFRALYLGWLFSAVYGGLDPDQPEPPVPAGLGLDELTAPLKALARFICLKEHHLEAAAEASRKPSPHPGDDALRRWLGEQPATRKDDWLMQAINGRSDMLGTTLRREFSATHKLQLPGQPVTTSNPRTAGEVYERAQTLRKEREVREREKRQREKRQRQKKQKLKRNAHLDQLAGQEKSLWAKIEILLKSYKPRDYDAAVKVLVDLRDLAARQGAQTSFSRELADFKKRYARRRSLMERMDKVGL